MKTSDENAFEDGSVTFDGNVTKINLNERVKVKLTDFGKDIFYHQYDELNKVSGRVVFEPEFPKVDEDGYASFVLWQFMLLYGDYMEMGERNVIKPLEIIYTGE